MALLNPKVIIASAIYLVIIIISGIWVIKPLMGRVDQDVANLKTRYQEFKNTSDKYASLQKVSSALAEIEQAKTVAARAIPPTRDQDRLLLTLEQVSRDNSITVKTLKITEAAVAAPAPTKQSGNDTTSKTDDEAAAPKTTAQSALKSVPGSLEVSGTYDNIKKWVVALEQLDRIITLDTVVLSTTTAGTDPMIATINFTAYALSDE